MDQESKLFPNIFNDSSDAHPFLLCSLHYDPLPQFQDIPLNFSEAQHYDRDIHPQKIKRIETRKGKKRRQKRKYSSEMEINKGHWSIDENKMYHRFLQIHSRHFLVKNLRRQDKIFKIMSSFILTRKAEQCRSHHQKMEKKYRSFYKIIGFLRQSFYNSHSPDYIQEEIQQNGHLNYDPLITEVDIQNEGRKEGREKDSQILDKINEVNGEQILGEEYEKTFTHLAFE